jgi:hypothetical protein
MAKIQTSISITLESDTAQRLVLVSEKLQTTPGACNSHAVLVAALEQVVFVLEDEYQADRSWPCIAQARAALAGAKD